MANAYCPKGHRISYAATKPITCPSCGSEMAIKVTVASSTPPPSSSSSPGGQYYQAPARMTIRASRVPSRSIKIEDLRKSGIAVERSDDRRATPQGAEVVTADKIVADMIKGGTAE